MKDKDVLAFIPIFIVGFVLGVALVMIVSIFAFNNVEKENSELKTQNHKLERQLLELYTEQAEQTKEVTEVEEVTEVKKPYEISYPKHRTKVYYISIADGKIKVRGYDVLDNADKYLYDIGLLFNTEEEAEQFKREQTLIKKIKCWAKEQQEDWEPDWSNIDECKYYIEPLHFDKKIRWDKCWTQDKLPKLPYFKSEEIALTCIDEFGDEILEVFC